MKRIAFILVPFLLSPLGAQVLPYDSTERAQLISKQAKALEDDIATIRPQLFRNLGPREAAIVASITFEVPDGEGINRETVNDCYAFTDNRGRRRVHIGLLFARGLHMFIDAQLLSRAMNRPELGEKYVNYILAGWAENARLQQRNLAPKPIESPYTYLHASQQVLDSIEAPSAEIYGGALAFAMAHEAGHHVLGHTVEGRKQSLDNEIKADAWAMQTMIGSGEPPTAGLLIAAYWSALFESDSANATHPSSKDRSVVMIQSTLDNLDRFADRARQNGVSIESIRARLTADLKQLGGQGGVDPPNTDLGKALREALRAEVTGGSSLPDSINIDDETSLRCAERSHLTCRRSFKDSERAREVYQSLIQVMTSIDRECRNSDDNTENSQSFFCPFSDRSDIMLFYRPNGRQLEVSVEFFKPAQPR
jgi:hypothetical protein